MNFEVEIPSIIFPGFYNTYLDPQEHINEDEYSNEEEFIQLFEFFKERIISNIINHYQEVLPREFEIVSHRLFSPREYNYMNDKIILEIVCSYEDILFYFFNYSSENLIDYVEFNNYRNNEYHIALLETFLGFIPFTGKYEDFHEEMLYEKFIYE